jgi:dTDP-4-dehydrorhamnose reductase
VRISLTGASGFVGCNIAKVLADRHGDDVFAERIDMTDRAAVEHHVNDHQPDAIIHCAILNDWDRMWSDRHYAWDCYVEATRFYTEASQRAGIPCVVVSTDWVFDGIEGNYRETDIPNPTNFYGFLKAATEIVALERGATVARVSGVNGPHWARPSTPRAQDPGFGYFVASIVDALEAGEPFTVWESDLINSKASPSLASMCGEVMRVALATPDMAGKIVHCCGSEAVTRRQLALTTCDVFGLDPSLLRFGPPPASELEGKIFPHDTSLDATWTSQTLGTPLPTVAALLEGFLHERTTGQLAHLT